MSAVERVNAAFEKIKLRTSDTLIAVLTQSEISPNFVAGLEAITEKLENVPKLDRAKKSQGEQDYLSEIMDMLYGYTPTMQIKLSTYEIVDPYKVLSDGNLTKGVNSILEFMWKTQNSLRNSLIITKIQYWTLGLIFIKLMQFHTEEDYFSFLEQQNVFKRYAHKTIKMALLFQSCPSLLIIDITYDQIWRHMKKILKITKDRQEIFSHELEVIYNKNSFMINPYTFDGIDQKFNFDSIQKFATDGPFNCLSELAEMLE